MAARRKARLRALDVLYESDLRGLALDTTLAQRAADPDRPLNPYARTLVDGVVAHQERIDALLAEHSRGWALERMPTVDRNVLRIGAYELLWGEVPEDVALSEATDIAAELSTEASPSFVNGLLGRLRDLKPGLLLEEQP